MTWLFLIGVGFVMLFSFVILFGAPFLPTLRNRTREALDLLDLRPGDTLLELGSGDGRILRQAAERGIHAIGYELNPVLVLWSRLLNLRYRKLIKVKTANYWRHNLPPADGIYVFLLNPYMAKLDKKIIHDMAEWQSQKGHKKTLKVVSFAFKIPGKTPKKSTNGLMLYEYRPVTTVSSE